jgi:hypothetical protein
MPSPSARLVIRFGEQHGALKFWAVSSSPLLFSTSHWINHARRPDCGECRELSRALYETFMSERRGFFCCLM